MVQQAKIIVSGRVQGVYFRVYTRDKAKSLGLKGTVKNLPNGSVEIIAEGYEEKLRELIKWAKKGSPNSRVDDVTVKISEAKGMEATFAILV